MVFNKQWHYSIGNVYSHNSHRVISNPGYSNIVNNPGGVCLRPLMDGSNPTSSAMHDRAHHVVHVNCRCCQCLCSVNCVCSWYLGWFDLPSIVFQKIFLFIQWVKGCCGFFCITWVKVCGFFPILSFNKHLLQSLPLVRCFPCWLPNYFVFI